MRFQAFEKFCAKVALPNLEPKSIASVKEQLAMHRGWRGSGRSPTPRLPSGSTGWPDRA